MFVGAHESASSAGQVSVVTSASESSPSCSSEEIPTRLGTQDSARPADHVSVVSSAAQSFPCCTSEEIPASVGTQPSATAVGQVSVAHSSVESFCIFLRSRVTPDDYVLSCVLPFVLCLRLFSDVVRVCRSWCMLANSNFAWLGSTLDLTRRVVPRNKLQRFIGLWSCIDAAVVDAASLKFIGALMKPYKLRSSWLNSSIMDSWHRMNMGFGVHCCTRMSDAPVYSIVSLRLYLHASLTGSLQTRSFSIGWTDATSPAQLGRCITGERMTAEDNPIHVHMLNFPDVFSHPKAELSYQYIQGPVPGGIEESRHVKMTSPFHDVEEFDLVLELDAAGNAMRGVVCSSISFVTTLNIPLAAYPKQRGNHLSGFRFFMYSQTALAPPIHCDFYDVDPQSVVS